MTIRPSYRELLAETSGWFLLFVLELVLSHLVLEKYGIWFNVFIDMAAAAALIFFITTRYVLIRNIKWIISDETICREQGVLMRQTDYVELYRVVDYTETQTFMQRIFGVKTVLIISTDKLDRVMPIYGVPRRLDIVRYIRTKVEHCKQIKRIYEITNN